MLFVLSDGENSGSFLFGPDKKACFMAENPATLYTYSSDEQRSLIPLQQSSPLLVQQHEQVKLAKGDNFQSVKFSFEMCSYLILWLLEEVIWHILLIYWCLYYRDPKYSAVQIEKRI